MKILRNYKKAIFALILMLLAFGTIGIGVGVTHSVNAEGTVTTADVDEGGTIGIVPAASGTPSLQLTKNSHSTYISSGSYVNGSWGAIMTNSEWIRMQEVNGNTYDYTPSADRLTFSRSENGWYKMWGVRKGFLGIGTVVSVEYTVGLDTTKPILTAYANGATVSNNSTVKHTITHSATDNFSGVANYYFSLNGGSYLLGSANASFSADGVYKFYCTDKSGNSSNTLNVTKDGTAPTIRAYNGSTQLSNGALTMASSVRFEASDATTGVSGIYVQTPGATYYTMYTGTSVTLSAEGTYFYYAKDVAGNQSSTYSVTIDRTAPTVHLYSGTAAVSNNYYSAAMYTRFTATDANGATCYMKKDNGSYSVYTSGNNLSAEGVYSFYAVDAVGISSSTYTITLDRTAPVGTLYAGATTVPSGKITNASYVTYTATDNLAFNALYVMKPGTSSYVSFASGTQFTVDGWYYFYSSDKSGNCSPTVSILLDRTKPTIKIFGDTTEIASTSYTNKSVTFSVTDAGSGVASMYVRLPGSSNYISYVSGTPFNIEGTYYFYAIDVAGSVSDTVNVKIDKTKPSGTLKAGGITISSGSYTNQGISFTATDESGISSYQYKIPGSSSWLTYISGTNISGTNGLYTFRATDAAGTVSDEYTVYYDASMPTGALYGGMSSKTNGSYTNADYVKYEASSAYSGVGSCYVKLPNSGEYTSYTNGSQLTTEGTYSFYCVSRAGTSSSVVMITLDKTKPVGTLYGGTNVITNGGYTNTSYIYFQATDKSAISAYVKQPGSSSYTGYTLGTHFTLEGTYSFYAVDAANNTSDIYTVVLSREIPAAQLYVDGVAIGNNSYTNGAHISFECAETCYVMLPSASTYVPYLSGAEYYQPGKYVFYGISSANNHSGYYTLVIDRTAKPLEFINVYDGITNGDVIIDWVNGNPDKYAPVKTVKVNGKNYEMGMTIYTINTGVYNVFCEDAAGNTWTGVFSSTKQNVLTETLQKKYYEAPDSNGNYYAFSTYESAFNFAMAREMPCVRTAIWNNPIWDTGIAMDAKDSVNAANGTYFIYKKSGNPEVEVAYFTEERLREVFAEYAAIGIMSYYYWEKEPSVIHGGENLYTYSETKTILAYSVSLGENAGFLINGEILIGKSFDGEGFHILTALDEWGNTCDYTLIIVRRAPDILYALGEGSGNTVTYDRNYYFKSAVTVFIADEYDEFAMFNVYSENGKLLACLSLGEIMTFDKSGKYTVQAVNHFGMSEVFTLIVSIDAPKAEIIEKTKEKQLEIKITESIDAYSHLQTLEIYKSIDGGKTWILVDIDDYGNLVSLNRKVYVFRTTGLYKIVLTDEFRTGIDAVTLIYDYTQAKPEGVLTGVENGGYTNGNVSFIWTDEAIVILKKDGEVISYKSGQMLTEDGNYILTFENYDGYKATYSFSIDTAVPEVSVIGVRDYSNDTYEVENDSSVNTDVFVSWEEEGLTAELYESEVLIGEYVSGTILTECGNYRIIVKDAAKNLADIRFSIDKIVDFAINVNDKGLANSVTVTGNEELSVILKKDGEVVSYALGEKITADGHYVLEISDKLGNSNALSFTIIKSLVQSFEHNFDDIAGFEKVIVDGKEKRLNYGTLELRTCGTYEVEVLVNGVAYNFTVTVDNTAPTIVLDGVDNGGETKGTVILMDMSEQAEIMVYLNDAKIDYEIGNALNLAGKYRVVLNDACGNRTEYSFEILKSKTLSGGVIALIVISVIAVLGVGVFFALKKFKKI